MTTTPDPPLPFDVCPTHDYPKSLCPHCWQARAEKALTENERLRSLLVTLYTDAGTTEDAGDFILDLRERLKGETLCNRS